MVGVDAKRHHGQKQHLGPRVVSRVAGPAADFLDLEIVGPVGHVQVMRFGGAEGENGDLPALAADEGVILFGENVRPHRVRPHPLTISHMKFLLTNDDGITAAGLDALARAAAGLGEAGLGRRRTFIFPAAAIA